MDAIAAHITAKNIGRRRSIDRSRSGTASCTVCIRTSCTPRFSRPGAQTSAKVARAIEVRFGSGDASRASELALLRPSARFAAP
jgi:hypothetical protein